MDARGDAVAGADAEPRQAGLDRHPAQALAERDALLRDLAVAGGGGDREVALPDRRGAEADRDVGAGGGGGGGQGGESGGAGEEGGDEQSAHGPEYSNRCATAADAAYAAPRPPP